MKKTMLFALLMAIICIPVALAKAPVPGEWTINADFGQLKLLVNNDSTSITNLDIKYENFACNGKTKSGGVGITNYKGWPIINGQFTIETDIGGSPGESPDKVIIQGQFDATGRQATGTWKEIQSYPGGTCSCSFS